MSSYIKASPEALEQMAAETEKSVSIFTDSLNEILELAANTASYWTGDAAEICRSRIQQKNEAVQLVLARFKEWTVDLNTMGQTYRSAEQTAQSISADLESDVIY